MGGQDSFLNRIVPVFGRVDKTRPGTGTGLIIPSRKGRDGCSGLAWDGTGNSRLHLLIDQVSTNHYYLPAP